MCKFTVIHENSGYSPSRMSNVELFGIFKKAAKLTKDPCNGCRTVVSQRHFALSPRYLGRLKKGAMEALESEIGHYSESLGGVPLAYCNLQLLQQTGNILDDQPYIHFNVSFKAVIFKPSVGSILKCVVNELAKDHVSCLVHNWFNLSLPLRGSDAEERLPKGSKVMAKVTKIQAKNGILAIQGTPTEERFSDLPLVDPLKENGSDEEGVEDTVMEIDAPEKRKHDSGFISDPENSARLPVESTSENDGENVGKKKKKKKRESENRQMMDDIVVKVEPDLDVSADGGMEAIIEGEVREGKKKKKKKRETEDRQTLDDIVVKVELDLDVSADGGMDGITEGEGREGKKKKRKKKDKVMENEMNDSLLEMTIKEEPDLSPDESSIVDDGLIVEQITEKKKKKKRKSHMDHDVTVQENIVVKTEVMDPGELIENVSHSSKKKKKKKHKERDSDDSDQNIVNKVVQSTSEIKIKEELESDGDQRKEKKAKIKKHKQRHSDHPVSESDGGSDEQSEKQNKLKRKHSDVLYNLNGGGDHGERTTQHDMHGTDEGVDGVPKKKKKKKKHIKEEVM